MLHLLEQQRRRFEIGHYAIVPDDFAATRAVGEIGELDHLRIVLMRHVDDEVERAVEQIIAVLDVFVGGVTAVELQNLDVALARAADDDDCVCGALRIADAESLPPAVTGFRSDENSPCGCDGAAASLGRCC